MHWQRGLAHSILSLSCSPVTRLMMMQEGCACHGHTWMRFSRFQVVWPWRRKTTVFSVCSGRATSGAAGPAVDRSELPVFSGLLGATSSAPVVVVPLLRDSGTTAFWARILGAPRLLHAGLKGLARSACTSCCWGPVAGTRCTVLLDTWHWALQFYAAINQASIDKHQ